ncbi:hypothetical protein ACOTI9_14960 [Achromobacter mucicolens]|uniref:hypothetical protein n=1 Tax=Achromobacter mucicolens TaxID=1389922 RepID=UPI003B9BE99A
MSEKNEWKPIESAPKTGRKLLLGYWNSHGKWRTVRGQWVSADHIAESFEDPDDAEEGWFETSAEADDVPNCWPVTPSQWQPLPAAPCQTCNGHGMLGGLTPHSGYESEPCPDCTPPASAQDDAKDGWSIDTSAGRPILVRNNCSVIEAEDAEYVLRLIAADRNKAPSFATSIFGERIGGMLDGRAPAAPAAGDARLLARALDLLERNKPFYGQIGSRDVDVGASLKDWEEITTEMRSAIAASQQQEG